MIIDASVRERAYLEEIRRLQDELRDAYRLRRPISVWGGDEPAQPNRPREIALRASLLVPDWPKLSLNSALSVDMWQAAPQSLPFLVEDCGRALIRKVEERQASMGVDVTRKDGE